MCATAKNMLIRVDRSGLVWARVNSFLRLNIENQNSSSSSITSSGRASSSNRVTSSGKAPSLTGHRPQNRPQTGLRPENRPRTGHRPQTGRRPKTYTVLNPDTVPNPDTILKLALERCCRVPSTRRWTKPGWRTTPDLPFYCERCWCCRQWLGLNTKFLSLKPGQGSIYHPIPVFLTKLTVWQCTVPHHRCRIRMYITSFTEKYLNGKNKSWSALNPRWYLGTDTPSRCGAKKSVYFWIVIFKKIHFRVLAKSRRYLCTLATNAWT